MGLLDSIFKAVSTLSGGGSARLQDAATSDRTKNKPGVYLLILNGDVKKAGSAEIGIQKRMQQYYGLNKACGLNEYITESNRDQIRVKWQYCDRNQCLELESKLNDKYEKNNSMEWTRRRPRANTDTVRLEI